MSDCRFGVLPVNYPDPDPEALMVVPEIFAIARYQTLSVGSL